MASLPRYQLRDLDRPARWLVVVLIALLAVPFVTSVVRAERQHWVASGDDAVIAVRVDDSLTRHPPVIGLPSTSDLYAGSIQTNHPGPLEFYLLAIPARVLGQSLGLLLGSAVINFGSVLIALWVVLRRAGPAVALWAAVILAFTVWSTGAAVLSDPISSNIGGYPLLALTALAWALCCGDQKLLPLAAFVGSFAAQQHLAVLVPVAAVGAWGVVGFLVTWFGPRAVRRRDRGRLWPWLGAGVALVALLWSPVMYQQATGHPGNITAVIRYTRTANKANEGIHSGISQVFRVAGLPPWLLRNNLTGFDLPAPLNPWAAVSGALVLLLLATVAIVGFRRRPDLARLGLTGLVVAVGGVAAGSSVPHSIEADRINLYRWSWALTLCTFLVVGWLVGLAIRRWGTRVTFPSAGTWALNVVAVVAVIAVTVASVATVGPDDVREDAAVFGLDRQLSSAAVRAVAAASDRPVVVVSGGSMAALSVAPAITARLAAAGIGFQVPANQANAYGSRRTLNPATAGSALVVVSSFGPLPKVPGRRLAVADLNPALVAPVDRLLDQALSQPIVLSPAAPAVRKDFLPSLATAAATQISRLHSSPYAALTSPNPLTMLLHGYLSSPRLDHADLVLLQSRLLAGQTLTVWGDDRVALYQLTIPELRRYRPDLFR